MYNAKLLFAMSQVEDKVKATVAKALSDKLQTEVDKNKIVEAIEGIDVEKIVNTLFIKNGIGMIDITSDDSEIKDYMYQQRIDVRSINLPNAQTIGMGAFQTCVSLKSINLPNAITFKNGSFYRCISLYTIHLPDVTEISTRLFQMCLSLESVAIDTNQVCTLSNTNAFENTPIANGTGYIYVPDELVEDYKVATNWSVYADQIKPMSECEE